MIEDEDERVRALTLKLCEAAKGVSLGVLMRAFGRMTRLLAGFLGMPVDDMLQTIIIEATELERFDDEETHTTH
jgi:hypothetical protein